jgi:hypothetical protein
MGGSRVMSDMASGKIPANAFVLWSDCPPQPSTTKLLVVVWNSDLPIAASCEYYLGKATDGLHCFFDKEKHFYAPDDPVAWAHLPDKL